MQCPICGLIKPESASHCVCGYAFAETAQFQTRLELRFNEPDEGCVRFESTATGADETFAELLTFCSLAVRQLVILGPGSDPAQSFAGFLGSVDVESLEILPRLQKLEGFPRLVDCTGAEGQERFVLNLNCGGTEFTFNMSAEGFESPARDADVYAPNSVLLFLKHLATRHQHDKSYLRRLASAAAACGEVCLSGQLGMKSQSMLTFSCAIQAKNLPEVSGSHQEEFDRCLDAAKEGDLQAQVALGQFYGANGRYDEAIGWYRKAADQGDPAGQRLMGDLYREGVGVERDPAKAHDCYVKAAEQDEPWAQVTLGEMYIQGEGVEKDPKMAAHWWTKAAEQGMLEAQLHLGHLYKEGDGVTQDSHEALKWFKKAAALESPQAQNAIAILYREGTGADEDRDEAVELFKKAADQGYAYAQYNLGECYEKGDVLPQDLAEAFKWYYRAAQNGLIEAQFKVAMIYEVSGRIDEAKHWYMKAANQGHEESAERMKELP